MTAQLRAVFFDIDDTLYSTSEFAALARRNGIEAMRRYGLRLPTEMLLKELEEVIAEFSTNYEHHFDKLLLRMPRRAYAGVNPGLLIAAGVSAYHDTKMSHLQPFPDAVDALTRLADTDLIRGIITAGLEVKQSEKIIRLKIYDLLTPTAIFISDQIGVSKPNPKLYLKACEETGIRPGEAMYVGDHPVNDIDPPNSIGMITVRQRRGGRHQNEPSATPPTHEIRDFQELLEILKTTYGVAIKT